MSEVRATVHLAGSPCEVWSVVMDPRRLGDWVTIHRGLGHVSAGPPRTGFTMDQQLTLRGASFHVRWELVDCEPERRAVWEGHGPARSSARTEYRLRAENGGTRFDYVNEFRAPLGPLGAMASRALVGGISQREAHRTLERLQGLFAAKERAAPGA
jgi:carbon monoxide dehydrogenase subunit G